MKIRQSWVKVLLVGLMLTEFAASDVSAASSPNAYLKGIYDCSLTGAFIAQPFSNAQMQFRLDGAGNVVSTFPGELIVTLGQFNTPQSQPTPDSFSHTFIHQLCDYSVSSSSAGTYSLNGAGFGTLAIGWEPAAGNTGICTDCITTKFQLLVNSPSSFQIMSLDMVNGCSGTATYATCGSALAGICTLQSSKL